MADRLAFEGLYTKNLSKKRKKWIDCVIDVAKSERIVKIRESDDDPSVAIIMAKGRLFTGVVDEKTLEKILSGDETRLGSLLVMKQDTITQAPPAANHLLPGHEAQNSNAVDNRGPLLITNKSSSLAYVQPPRVTSQAFGDEDDQQEALRTKQLHVGTLATREDSSSSCIAPTAKANLSGVYKNFKPPARVVVPSNSSKPVAPESVAVAALGVTTPTFHAVRASITDKAAETDCSKASSQCRPHINALAKSSQITVDQEHHRQPSGISSNCLLSLLYDAPRRQRHIELHPGSPSDYARQFFDAQMEELSMTVAPVLVQYERKAMMALGMDYSQLPRLSMNMRANKQQQQQQQHTLQAREAARVSQAPDCF